VVRLVAISPCEGLLPVEAEGATLIEVTPEAITSVAPFKGREKAVSAALEAAVGGALPKPNRTTGKGGVRVIWTGPGQAMVLGSRVAPEGAAVTDQSDAWAVLSLEGPRAEAALARLVPLDVRRAHFKTGHTARTQLRHMTCSLTRVGASAFEVMVFRSMAKTAVEELERAMRSVSAQA